MSSILTLNYSFEETLNDIRIIEGAGLVNGDSVKKVLRRLENEFNQDKKTLSDIEGLDAENLKTLNTEIKAFNGRFDSLNDLYYNSDYFNDGELKQLFTSLSRHYHKIENLSHKYLHKHSSTASTFEYIKEGLSKLSGDAIAKKLSSGN